MSPAPETAKKRWIRFAIIAAVFLLTRGAFHLMGVRFDASPITHFWQFVDPALLKTRLFESLFYLHSQPPLYNFFLGLILKLFPGSYAIAFHVAYLLMGLVLVLALEELMRELGFNAIPRRLFLFVFAASPSVILYENWLFYTYPVAVLLVLAPLLLMRFLHSGRGMYAHGFFLILAGVALTRASFHLLWLLAVGLCVLPAVRLSTLPGIRRRTLIAAAIPLLLVTATYGKNYILFDGFGTSSWLGINLARATTNHLPPETRRDLREKGKLSKVATIKPFLGPYPATLFSGAKPAGIPVLDARVKSGGAANFNHTAYIAISRMHLNDAKYFLRNHSGLYARKTVRAFFWFFVPSHANAFFKKNYPAVRRLADIHNKYFQAHKFGLPLYTMLPTFLGTLFGLWHLMKLYAGRAEDSARSAAAAMMAVTILFAGAVSVLLEFGENNRFRFPLEAPSYVLFGMLISPGVRRGSSLIRAWIHGRRLGKNA